MLQYKKEEEESQEVVEEEDLVRLYVFLAHTKIELGTYILPD